MPGYLPLKTESGILRLGYRSLHLIVSIPVFLAESRMDVKVEVQIRTIAMDFRASLEHRMKYKKRMPDEAEVYARLKECADVIADTDGKMLDIRRHIESAEDERTEEEELFDRMRRFDTPIN